MLKILLNLFYLNVVLTESTFKYCKPEIKEIKCYHGTCSQLQNNSDSELSCLCNKGWSGLECKECGARISLEASAGGVIIDGYGNYSIDSRCSWLIQGQSQHPLRIVFEEFATECSWDHLYVFDGDSIFSPLVAVYSGLLLTETIGNAKTIPEITLESGSAFLHFYSDAAYHMTGFKISYRQSLCAMNCSGHGVCDKSMKECVCDSEWMGVGCHIPMCPSNCSGQPCREPNPMEAHKSCDCDPSQAVGLDCSLANTKGHWKTVHTSRPSFQPHGRGSHKSVLIGRDMWVIGGYMLDESQYQNIVVFDTETEHWRQVEPMSGSLQPRSRYGHSLVTYKESILMYGGVIGNTITDELWLYNTSSNEWVPLDLKFIHSQHSHSGWLGVVGHTAHVIDGIMYVIFGHNPIYGYLNSVQECNMSTFVFRQAVTSGAIVKGGYGHVSAYDAHAHRILVHGGYHSGSLTEYRLSGALYSYDLTHKRWTILRSSGSSFYPQYLHTAGLTDGLLLLFAGNTHNDSSQSRGAKCFSSSFMAYDLDCDSWHALESPLLHQDSARFGHSAEIITRKLSHGIEYSMLVYGGFTGRMRSDVLLYKPGNCAHHVTREACLWSREGVKCVWADERACMSRSEAMELLSRKSIMTYTPLHGQCHRREDSDPAINEAACARLSLCPSCLSSTAHCEWVVGRESKCVAKKTGPGTIAPQGPRGVITDINQCYTNQSEASTRCSTLHNCHACQADKQCLWSDVEKKCKYRKPSEDKNFAYKCKSACAEHTSCENCTNSICMWCGNQQRCVDSNAYVASFPYGQCMEWITLSKRCPSTRCSELRTCDECHAHPACGWCDDGSRLGIGKCMQGGLQGPVTVQGGGGGIYRIPVNANQHSGGVLTGNDVLIATVDNSTCPAPRWFFAKCPLCQCNGHSACREGTDHCIACRHMTTGPHCESCQSGYHGNPRNGQNCSECSCSGHADTCNQDTGACFCNTRWVEGDQCDKCDNDHSLYVDLDGDWSCYKLLEPDMRYKFNLSKSDELYRHYTRINFYATPPYPDRDVEFYIKCSDRAFMNLTIKTDNGEDFFLPNVECLLFTYKFSKDSFNFGARHNTTFYVNVYGFTTPFLLDISFSQLTKIDLMQFFVKFFGLMLTLLTIAVIFWKVKQRYDRYQAIQRMKVERQQWANRPFAFQRVVFGESSGVKRRKSSRRVLSDKSEENKQLCEHRQLAERKTQVTDSSKQVLEHKRHPPDHSGTTDAPVATQQPPPTQHSNKLNKVKYLEKSHPSLLALEPMRGNKTGLMSVIFEMPHAGCKYTPPGVTGMNIGTALILLGPNHKALVETSKSEKITYHKSGKLDNDSNCPENIV